MASATTNHVLAVSSGWHWPMGEKRGHCTPKQKVHPNVVYGTPNGLVSVVMSGMDWLSSPIIGLLWSLNSTSFPGSCYTYGFFTMSLYKRPCVKNSPGDEVALNFNIDHLNVFVNPIYIYNDWHRKCTPKYQIGYIVPQMKHVIQSDLNKNCVDLLVFGARLVVCVPEICRYDL